MLVLTSWTNDKATRPQIVDSRLATACSDVAADTPRRGSAGRTRDGIEGTRQVRPPRRRRRGCRHVRASYRDVAGIQAIWTLSVAPTHSRADPTYTSSDTGTGKTEPSYEGETHRGR